MAPIEVTMEIHEHPNKRFMKKYNRYEPVIKDHTAMIQAKQCLRMYFYRIVLGRTPNETAPWFAWGSAYHKFREHLERTYGFGENAPPKFDQEKANLAFATAADVGIKYWKNHGKDEPVGSKYEFYTTERLLKSFVEAFKHWSREKQRGQIVVVAVEQAFNVMLPDGSHRSGRADQIVRWQGKLWGRDFKTTSKDTTFYSRGIDPNEQFTGYTYAEAKLAGEPVQGQLIEVLYNAKATKNKQNGPEIFEFTASRTKYQLDKWEEEHQFWNKVIDQAREADVWPMVEVSCPFCPFHSVCKQPSEVAMMYQLETQYKVEPWDNTKLDLG